MEGLNAYRDFGVALAVGLLTGVERGWRLRDEQPGKRVAGVRTFALVGGLGGASAILSQKLHPFIPVLIVGGAVAMLVIAHVRALEGSGEVSATNLIAALLTLVFGLAAGIGMIRFAIAGAAVTTLILSLRTELHGLLAKLGETDIKALARFAIIAGAILPFLPNKSFGPFGAWNPFQLWIVVVLVTGFSFAAYVANRMVGVKRGTLATTVIAGAYSSTAVTAALAHRLREEPEARATLAAAIILASAVMFLRVIILTAIIVGSAMPSLAMVIAPGAAVAFATGIYLARNAPAVAAPPATNNPIDPAPALAFLLFVAAMSLATRWAQAEFGDTGIATLTFVAGIFDIDAAIVTLGGLPIGTLRPEIAGLILACAALANMALKLSIITLYAGWTRGKSAILALGASSAIVGAMVAIKFATLDVPS